MSMGTSSGISHAGLAEGLAKGPPPPLSMIDCNPTKEEKDRVLQWLREFNHSESGGGGMKTLADGAEQPLFLAARDSGGELVGGLQATLLHKWLKIEIMAVNPGERNRGIGRQLVAEAERRAMMGGCQFTHVDTMSYQAPGFYPARGYQECGRLKDWDSHGHDKIFFTKSLARSGPESDDNK